MVFGNPGGNPGKSGDSILVLEIKRVMNITLD
jgi:hypothetical protein